MINDGRDTFDPAGRVDRYGRSGKDNRHTAMLPPRDEQQSVSRRNLGLEPVGTLWQFCFEVLIVEPQIVDLKGA